MVLADLGRKITTALRSLSNATVINEEVSDIRWYTWLLKRLEKKIASIIVQGRLTISFPNGILDIGVLYIFSLDVNIIYHYLCSSLMSKIKLGKKVWTDNHISMIRYCIDN